MATRSPSVERSWLLGAAILGALLAAGPAHAQFVVTTTGDAGGVNPLTDGICDSDPTPAVVCTLRAAIDEANNTAGADVINFNIGGGGPQVITPGSSYNITQQVTIDGTTQGGYAGTPIIEINGSGPGTHGFNVNAGTNTVIRGLVIAQFSPSAGIRLMGGSGTVIAGNYIGTDQSGTLARPNNPGIYIQTSTGNRIGGTVAADFNLISGNAPDGIQIFGAGTTGNLIQGNYIGLNVNGTAALPNTTTGIAIWGGASSNTIGGTSAAAMNVISGNTSYGVSVSGATTGIVIQGNRIGTDKNGTAAVPNAIGISLLGGTNGNAIGGALAGAGNLISGNSGNGVLIDSSTNNTVLRNRIGTNAAGTGKVANGQHGVQLSNGANSNTIGGVPADGNLISGNGLNGIDVVASSTNNILGNLIGLNAGGTAGLSNTFQGVAFAQASTGNTLGSAAGPNVISGNGQHGVRIVDPNTNTNTVQNNYIGLNQAGTAAVANAGDGVILDAGGAASGNTIGVVGLGNVISGNGGVGVRILNQMTATTVVANIIGRNAADSGNVANSSGGVRIENSSGNTIGGTAANTGNVIAGNSGGSSGDGVGVVGTGTGNAILGNSIYANAGLGIDLGDDGITGAESDLDDADTGPNNHQNTVKLSGVTTSGTWVHIAGSLDAVAGAATYRVEFFKHTIASADPTGYGEGRFYLGFVNVTTNASGDGIVAANLNVAVATTEYVTATVTDPSNNTSEFCRNYNAQGDLIVTTTADTVDGSVTSVAALIANPGTDKRISLREAIQATNATAGSDTILFGIPLTDVNHFYYTNDLNPGVSIASIATTTRADSQITDFDPHYLGTPFSWFRIQPSGSQLDPITDPVVIDAYTQPGAQANTVASPGTTDAILKVVLDGSLAGAGAIGLTVSGGSSAVRGLVIDTFDFDGIRLKTVGGDVVDGCYVGTDPTGTLDLGNTGDGIYVESIPGNTVGGTTVAARNLLSGNTDDGVEIYGAGSTGNSVQGNYVGVDASGTAPLGNTNDGIVIWQATNNTVGGTAAGAGNVVGANASGLYFGDVTGTGNKIEGNYIGTNAAGTAAVGNSTGIFLDANQTTVGGLAAAARNVISGNTWTGLWIRGASTVVQGNYFGTRPDGTTPLANARGIYLDAGAANSMIGGTAGGAPNRVVNSTNDGIVLISTAGSGNTFSRNAIHSNGGLGIDFDDDGPTANDAGDVDGGPNGRLNFPAIGYPMANGGTITLHYQLDTAMGFYRVEFFKNPSGADVPTGYGEGETYVSDVVVNHPGGKVSYNTSFPGNPGDVITATATECDDGVCTTPASTSEFSWARAALATAVELVSFEAKGGDGAVDLAWETGSELNNLGFHLYRGASDEGPWTRITASLIPGLGSSPLGARYSYRDAGLENGTTYHYLLEDVETTGRVERHGPVSATAGAPGGDDGGADEGVQEGHPARIAYGDPDSNELRVVRESGSGVVLELVTEGFYATAQEDGTVLLEVPGFESLSEPGWPSLPVKRSWVDAVAGRQVSLGRVHASGIEGFAGLRPADAGAPSVEVLEDGTIRAGQRRARRAYHRSEALYPTEAARLLDVGFQGERKRAFVELSPLRWDGETGQLLLARRLEVRVSFSGREPGEVSLGGSRGRRRPGGGEAVGGDVVARLGTREAGLYGVRFEEVFPGQGRAVRPTELRLSRQGETVAYRVEPDPKRYGPGSVLYFVSEGRGANPYGTEAVYELERGSGGVAMTEESASPRGATQPSLWRSGSWEETRYYLAALVQAEEPWYWARVFGGQSWSTGFELPGLAVTGEAGRLELWLQGGSDFEGSPDHVVRVKVNGTIVAETGWDGFEGKAVEAPLSPGVLVEGSNALEVENAGEAGASLVYVDRFRVGYPSRVEATAGVLEGRFSGSGRAEVQGVGSGARLLETSDPLAPRWLTGAVSGPGGVSLRVEAGGSYLAVDATAVKAPSVRLTSGSALSDAGAEYLVVGPRAYVAEAGPLLELRRSQGLTARAVAIEDVFDAYGHGEPRPQALVDFLRHAYHDWPEPRLRYAVLLGDASFDPQDLLGTGIGNPVPTPMVRSSFMWTASDLAYAAVNGEDALPDVALGRLPTSSPEEARALVEKIVAWESGGFGLDGPAVLVADNSDPAGDFEGDARRVASTLLSGHEVETILLGELGAPATRAEIRAAFDRGASLVSYLGHGALSMWASENVFGRSDLAALQPQAQQPVVLTMNCLNGYFVPPATDSLSELLVGAAGKGAIAAFSPSGLSIHGAAVQYHDALVAELISGRHHRLGDAILAAQLAYADTGELPELLSLYHLFGDPALSLR